MLSVNVASMIEDEIAWLSNFNPNCAVHSSELAADDILLTGEIVVYTSINDDNSVTVIFTCSAFFQGISG